MMEKDNKDYYKGENIAGMYAAYRPYYPQEVFDTIMEYHGQSNVSAQHLAVDVCCGTGRGTLPLTKYFTKVVGIDISDDQLKHVSRDCPNLETQLASAEDLSMFGPKEVDLVTIGMALHFVDDKRFFAEVQRILKPGGTFAAYSYTWETLDDEELDIAMQEIRDRVKQYYGILADTLFNDYRLVKFPFSDMKRVRGIKMPAKMTLEQYLGWLSSIHTIYEYDDNNKHEKPIVEQARERLTDMLGEKRETILDAHYNVFMILGRNF